MGFPPPGSPPPLPGFPPPVFPPPPPRLPPPGGPKGVWSGFGCPWPHPPPGGPDPPTVVFPATDPVGWVVACVCEVVCMVVAMKMLDQIFLGWRFIGAGIGSVIFCSSVSLLVVPLVGVGGDFGKSSSLDCSSGVSLASFEASISPQSDHGICLSLS